MLVTTEIPPSAELAPYVRCYCLNEMDTCGVEIVKPWHARHEMLLDFFLKDKAIALSNSATGLYVPGGAGHVLGIGTQYNGDMSYNGSFSLLSILFRPTGFYSVFGIPNREFTNVVNYGADVLGKEYKVVYEKLLSKPLLKDRVSILETYLLANLRLRQIQHFGEAINSYSTLIVKTAGQVNIEKLAYDANMSMKSFERHFTEQVGTSPKLFSCITRFNYALSLKIRHPDQDWTSVGLDAGYYDQMHLIKDFKRFTGTTPSSFLKITPLANEKFSSRVDDY